MEMQDDEEEAEHEHEPALLRNDDVELLRMESVLKEVHRLFYDAYESGKGKGKVEEWDVTVRVSLSFLYRY